MPGAGGPGPTPAGCAVGSTSRPAWSWLQGFASHQPVTPATETIRGLLLGTPVGTNPWLALGWYGGILALAVAASGWLFRRRTA